MKLIRTKGRGAAQTAQILAALERRGGAALDSVLPAVRRIVTDVRRSGDRAMLRYAAQFDGLAGAEALRVTPQEMAAAWKSLDPALREALETAAEQIRGFAKRQMPASWSMSPVRGLKTGQLVRPLELGRMLCSQRPSSLAFHASDDRDPCAGCGRQTHRGCFAKART